MKRGRIDTVAVQLPPTIEEGEGEPEDKEGGIRYDQMKNGWFVRAWVVNQTITGGPFKTKKKAKRWISKRIAKVRRSAS